MIFVYILIVLVLIYIFLIFPSGRSSKTKNFFKDQIFYAHRGLFDNQKLPENSLPAFAHAVEKGYGIELDVHLTADKQLVVFHDDTLTRMCGIDGKPEAFTYEELQNFSLLNTNETIPLFTDVLKVIDGKSPLIVEIKGTNGNTEICRRTAEVLDGYHGVYCMESFNPLYVRWFKKNRPAVVRGQLACRMEKSGSFKISALNFCLENMLFNFLSRPDFLAYRHQDQKMLSFVLSRSFSGFPVAWTVASKEQLASSKKAFSAFIFEQFEP